MYLNLENLCLPHEKDEYRYWCTWVNRVNEKEAPSTLFSFRLVIISDIITDIRNF